MQFTFFDFDENVLNDYLKQNGATIGDGRECVTASGFAQYALSPDSTVTQTEPVTNAFGVNTGKFCSSVQGTGVDNPQNPRNLDASQKRKTASFFFEGKSEITISLSVACCMGKGRSFMFGGKATQVPECPAPAPPPPPPLLDDGALRLRGGPPDAVAGRLEVLHEGQWGTVCFNEFDMTEAQVACAQLGLNRPRGHGVQTDDRAPYGWAEDTAPVWMDALRCQGYEARLADCDFGGLGQLWGQRNPNICRGNDPNSPNKWRVRTDVYVECTGHMPSPPPTPPSPPSPPAPPPSPPPSYESEGNPSNELCHPGCPQSLANLVQLSQAWRNTIVRASEPINNCDANGDTLAEAAWFQFSGAAGVRMPTEAPGYKRCGTEFPGWLSSAHPARGSFPVVGKVCFQNGVNECFTQTQVEVCACSYDGGASTTYTYKLPQGPRCMSAYCGTSDGLQPPPPPALRPPSPPPLPPSPPPAEEGTVRLVGGPSPAVGRLEVYHSGEWGTVCDQAFDGAEADVVCKQLGYGFGLAFGSYQAWLDAGGYQTTLRDYKYGNDPSRKIWMSELECKGSEARLANCNFHGFGQFWGVIDDCNHQGDVWIECSNQPPKPPPPPSPLPPQPPSPSPPDGFPWYALPFTYTYPDHYSESTTTPLLSDGDRDETTLTVRAAARDSQGLHAIPISFDLGRDVALREVRLTYVIDQVTRFAPLFLTLQGTNQAGVMETSTFTTQDSGWPTKCERAGPRPCTHTVTLSTVKWADVRTVVLSDVMPG